MKELLRLFWSFFKIGVFTFGGGYAMIPLIQSEMITNRKWIKESEFLELLTLAQSAPGPIAINTAVFIGYKMRGYTGALVTMLGVVIPSFAIIMLIALFFADIRHNPVIDAAFKGMRPAVVALILAPVLSLSKGMSKILIIFTAITAVVVWRFNISPIYLIMAGAAAGIVWELGILKRIKR